MAHAPQKTSPAVPETAESILAKNFGRVSKNFSPKVLKALLGADASEVIQAIWYACKSAQEAGEFDKHKTVLKVVTDGNGIDWVQASRAEIAGHVVVAKSTLFNDEGTIDRLLDLGLLHVQAWTTTTWFRVDHEKLMLLLALGYILYTSTKQDWLQFCEENYLLVSQFTYRRNKIPVALFPEVATDEMNKHRIRMKSFDSRTPFTVQKSEQELCSLLIKVFVKSDG